MGPTQRSDTRIKIHTSTEKGARSPLPVADSCGLRIIIIHSPSSRVAVE